MCDAYEANRRRRSRFTSRNVHDLFLGPSPSVDKVNSLPQSLIFRSPAVESALP